MNGRTNARRLGEGQETKGEIVGNDDCFQEVNACGYRVE